ncbi:exosome component EXOSC1/CSL4 domain-containing protein [Hirsutella rhossiliensis]|uniref:Exosome component EXOSC1/CSL4 domain-containing protein n=1 Tax=Hirsutella rhossiliensis TaxID=111463 RepID=A0A9P8N1E5_9HYPO|nr:exosome component EXOSC1/CSL4 domain-containing protein [Hirsutella rhossiliensis]KAH0965079.1 exosome component EXOSC1/CSL4 domain-containing protein [Hirsutella rhossiliensis]
MAVDDVPSVAIPGEPLGPVSNVTVEQPAKAPGPAKRLNKLTAPEGGDLATVSVARHGRRREVLPDVNNVVLARVVGDTVLQTEWQGVIRVQDVRATEKDKARIHDSFKPGDIVRAQVISLGDQANYYLSTAANELGVIMATSEAGNDMVPVSWKEYKDPETGLGEPRKVAKPS